MCECRQYRLAKRRLTCCLSFNSTQKEALAQEIFHRVVLEYLTCVYKFLGPEEADKKMHELLEA
jgi:hypothetical protein